MGIRRACSSDFSLRNTSIPLTFGNCRSSRIPLGLSPFGTPAYSPVRKTKYFVFRTGEYAGGPNGERPKGILLDLQLPKVSGIEVLRKLKSDEHARLIPIAVLTSSKGENDLEECYRLGVNSYIAKPVEFRTVHEYDRAARHVLD